MLKSQKNQKPKMESKSIQTNQIFNECEEEFAINSPRDLNSMLTSRKIDLLVKIEKQKMQLRKAKKKEHLQKQKINKMLFFFFTLQNKGIPVNDLYE